MANQNHQHPTRQDVLQARRDTLASTISRLEEELDAARNELVAATKEAAEGRRADLEYLKRRQERFSAAAWGATVAHQDQLERQIQRKRRRPYMQVGMLIALSAGLVLYTKSILVLGAGILVLVFVWRVVFGRHLLLSRRLGVLSLRRLSERETSSTRVLRREAEAAENEARRLSQSEPATPRQRRLEWQIRTLESSLRMNRARLEELDAELALY